MMNTFKGTFKGKHRCMQNAALYTLLIVERKDIVVAAHVNTPRLELLQSAP